MPKSKVNSKKSPKVIVLILSYNGKYLLEEAVSSYLANDYPNFSVVVIDNGSTDGTLEFVKAKFPGIKVLRTEKNLGYSGGLNLGLNHAFNGHNADYALVSNNDVKADKKVISELVKVAQTDEKIGFVTGKVYFYDRPNVLQSVGFREDPERWIAEHIGYGEEDIGQYDEVCERRSTDDVFALVRNSLYKDTGGYNTLFLFQGEQHDWQLRAKKLGYMIMYTPFAKLWHKVSATIGTGSVLQAYYDARNPLLVCLLHESPQIFRRYIWFHLRINIFRGSLVALKQAKMTKALAKWQGLVSGLMWGFRNRRFTLRHFI